MRQLSAIIFACLFSVPGWAFRARPLANLRFDCSGGTSHIAMVASDGKDFVTLTSEFEIDDSYGDEHVYAQRVVHGAPAGPRQAVGRGTAAGIVWTGVEYLAAWKSPEGVRTCRVSRQGAVIPASAELVLGGRPGPFASNGRSALAIGLASNTTITAQALDITGHRSGPAVTLTVPYYDPSDASTLAVGPTADGYAVVCTGWLGTSLTLLRPDGTPIQSRIVLEPADTDTTTTGNRGIGAWIATDGTDTVVLFADSKWKTDTQLKSVLIGPGGTIKRAAQTIYTATGLGEMSLFGGGVPVWDGSQYVMPLGISKDPFGNQWGQPETLDPVLLRITRSGALTGGITSLATGQGRKDALGLGWNGSDLLAVWNDRPHTVCALFSGVTMIAGPALLGRTLGAQDTLKIAASHGRYLAAWFETADTGIAIRASRLDQEGNYLDGDGIVLGIVDPRYSFVHRSLAIDGDGTNWLVVWGIETTFGRRLSRDGKLLETQPFSIAEVGDSDDVAVHWNGTRYIVVSTGGSLASVYSATVSADGGVTPPRMLAEGVRNSPYSWTTYEFPAIAGTSGQTLLAFQRDDGFCADAVQPYCGASHAIVAVRLDPAGVALDAEPLVVQADVWPGFALSANETHYLLIWTRYAPNEDGPLFGTFLPADAPKQGGNVFHISSDPYGESLTLAFNGHDFVAGSLNYKGTLTLSRISSDGTSTPSTTVATDYGEKLVGIGMAGDSTTPALLGLLDRHPSYDDVERSAFVFFDELTAPVPPDPPSITGLSRIDRNTVRVGWQPVGRPLGTSIELQLPDGSYRPIAVAAAGASSADVSLADIESSGLRLRAWNAAGLSEPSRTLSLSARQRAVR